jgi:hypothetical protein
MPLDEIQQQVLTGLMLGDGHLSIGGKSINARLRINRAARDISYAKWIAEVFSPYVTEHSLSEKDIYDDRHKRYYSRVAFVTRRHEDFTSWHKAWYRPKKHVPKAFQLTPLIVAVWFADDGSLYKKKCGGVEIKFNTSDFKHSEVQRLVALLNDRYEGGLKAYGNYNNNAQWVIMGSTRVARRLLQDIDAVFPPLDRKSVLWRSGFLISHVPRCRECRADAVFRDGRYDHTSLTGVRVTKQWFRCGNCKTHWSEPCAPCELDKMS